MTVNAADPTPGAAVYTPATQVRTAAATRWLQLLLGILCMAMIANLQYGWTLFVDPISKTQHWDRASGPMGLHDLRPDRDVARATQGLVRGSPRAAAGRHARGGSDRGRLDDELHRRVACGCSTSARWSAVWALRRSTAPASATRSNGFPTNAVSRPGATAAGFGAGAALTVVPIGNMIATSGYQHAFLVFGLGAGRHRAAGVAVPPSAERAAPGARQAPAHPAIEAEFQTRKDGAPAGVLAALPDLRDGRVRWPDDGRADRPDRPGLRDRQDTRGARRHHGRDADLRALARSRSSTASDARCSACCRIASGARYTMFIAFTIRLRSCCCCWARLVTRRSSSSSPRRSISSSSGKSTACFRQPAATRSARNSRRPMPASCTRRRARRPCSCPSRA